jgi:hypothetical protein
MADDDDPDLQHLFDLLRMLPGPTEDREFWTEVQHHTLPDTQLGYVYEKMTLIPRTVLDPSPGHISDLAKYLLIFFSGDCPELWDILGCIAPDFDLRHDQAGRLWANDLCETAWTLYVRYWPNWGASRPDEHWAVKWRYKSSWLEWLPPKTDGED